MNVKELEAKLVELGYDSEKIEEAVKRYEQTQKNREAMREQHKSYRTKIREATERLGITSDNMRFIYIHEDICAFVERKNDKAIVTFSFYNPKDLYVCDPRATKWYTLLNRLSDRYTYEVDWKGRSEFAVYDAYVEHHSEFPGFSKKCQLRFSLWC